MKEASFMILMESVHEQNCDDQIFRYLKCLSSNLCPCNLPFDMESYSQLLEISRSDLKDPFPKMHLFISDYLLTII